MEFTSFLGRALRHPCPGSKEGKESSNWNRCLWKGTWHQEVKDGQEMLKWIRWSSEPKQLARKETCTWIWWLHTTEMMTWKVRWRCYYSRGVRCWSKEQPRIEGQQFKHWNSSVRSKNGYKGSIAGGRNRVQPRRKENIHGRGQPIHGENLQIRWWRQGVVRAQCIREEDASYHKHRYHEQFMESFSSASYSKWNDDRVWCSQEWKSRFETYERSERLDKISWKRIRKVRFGHEEILFVGIAQSVKNEETLRDDQGKQSWNCV